MTPLAQLLEAALFSAARPLTVEELSTLDQEATLADVRMALEQIREHYDFEQHGVELLELAGGYQILTRPVHAAAIERQDAPLLYRWFNDQDVMNGWGWSAPARSMHTVAAQVEEWLARENAFGRPEALIAESLAGDPIGLIITDMNIGGKPRKALLVGNRNGFFYVIDRTNGQLISAEPIVKTTN